LQTRSSAPRHATNAGACSPCYAGARRDGLAAAGDAVAPTLPEAAMSTFTKVILYTDTDGRAKFREEQIALEGGTPQAMLSALLPVSACQLRQSPVGFRSQFHCTESPQWLFVTGGEMEIGLQDGSTRSFRPGEHFYSADTLPEGVQFDAQVHGHWSRQVGAHPLVTLFIKV